MNTSPIDTQENSSEVHPLIMIVEDDLEYLKELEGYLKQQGFNILSVTNPLTALNQIKKNDPNIILIEIQMKQLRGDSVIKALRKQGITTPVIVISGYINMELITALRELDIKGFFKKPVELEKLEEKIQSILSPKEKCTSEKTASPSAGKRNDTLPSLLAITEHKDIKKDPQLAILESVFEKRGFRIISKTSSHDSIEALKKPQNNIRAIMVNASDEAKTMTTAKFLNIIMLKLKIPVFFIADSLSPALQDFLIRLGFPNLVSLKGSTMNDIIPMFKSVLMDRHDKKQTRAKQQRIDIMRDLKVIKTLPPMPDTYYEIEKLARKPNTTASDFSKILELDTDVTARLLRMSNSVFYSFKREIRSVKDAVTLLGIREVLSLVQISWITGNLRVSPEIEDSVKKVWKHSAICAVTAKLIYDKTDICKEKLPDEDLFTGGILHDIGKIILWKFFPKIYLSYMLNSEISSPSCVDEESKFMGISHCEVGKMLAEHWQLPEPFVNVIAFHHKPKLKTDSDLVKIIHISDIVSHIVVDSIDDNQDLGLDAEIEKKGCTSDRIRSLAHELEPIIKEKGNLVLHMITG